MKIRSSHIAIIVLLVVGGFIVYATMLEKEAEAPSAEADQGAMLPPVPENPDDIPRIEVETTHYSLGVIPHDDLKKGQIMIYNRGTKNLEITDVQSSCPCTAGRMANDRKEIAPGKEAPLEVMVNPYLVPSFHSEKVLTIYSNDPTHPMVQVSVEADIDPEFEIIPELPYEFGDVEKGDPNTATLRIRQLQDEPQLELKRLEELPTQPEGPSPDDLILSFDKVPENEWKVPGKAEYDIHVGVAPTMPTGPFTRFFYIVSNTKRIPEYRYAVQGNVKAFYHMVPRYPAPLLLISKPDQESLNNQAVITADRPFEVTDLKADPAKLRVSARPGDEKNSVIIDVEVAPNAPSGQWQEDVTFNIKSDGKSLPEKVAVRALVPPKGVK